MNYLSRIVFKCVCIALLLFSVSCLKEHGIEISNLNQDSVINEWIYNTMYNYYYWNDHLPEHPIYSQSPQSFFKSLLYNEGVDDRFSWISDNAEENYNVLHGVTKEFGFEYFITYADTAKSNLVGVVLYVKKESPAQKSGIKRGDVFTDINGNILTKNNIQQLLNLVYASFIFISDNQKDTVTLNSEIVYENPILLSKIIDIDNKTIGYLAYTQFTNDKGDGSNEYTNELLSVFEKFKQDRITDLILDLRYNPGGQIDLAVTISSLITPNLDTTKTALSIEYNSKIMKYYDNENTNIRFKYYPNSYIGDNIHNIVFITSGQTASASEALTNILKAYTDVTIVGTTTYGKNVGSTMFTDTYSQSNWAIQPIILRLFNAKHESNYTHGFEPDININELNFKLIQLGDTSEPLLNTALSVITNSQKNSFSKVTKQSLIYNSINEKTNMPLLIKDINVPQP